MISLPSCSNDHFLRTVPKKSLKSFIRYDLDPGHVSQDWLKNFNHYLSLEFNSFLKSSTPISNPFMSLSSHAIFKHIFFDTLWTILLKSPFSKNVSEEIAKNFIRSDLDHWDPSQKESKHSSSIEIVIISQRSLVNNQSLRTSPKNFFK